MYDSIANIPLPVRKLLPIDAQEVFREAANEALNNGAAENEAIGAGWVPVCKNWHKPASVTGKWVKKPGFKKDGPTSSDVHVPGVGGGKKKEQKKLKDAVTVTKDGDGITIRFHGGEEVAKSDDHLPFDELRAKIVKVDEQRRVAYGWASVITENGVPVEDLQGDVWSPAEMMKSATEFMLEERVGKTNHQGEQTSTMVHSFPVTYELAKALGIDTQNEGWLVGVYIQDESTLAKVLSGELPCFSIGGSGERHQL